MEKNTKTLKKHGPSQRPTLYGNYRRYRSMNKYIRKERERNIIQQKGQGEGTPGSTAGHKREKQQIECLRKLPQIQINEQIHRRKERERNIIQQKGQGEGTPGSTAGHKREKEQIECLRKLQQIQINEQRHRRKGRERNIIQQKGQGEGTPGSTAGHKHVTTVRKQQIECLPGNYRRYRSMNKYIEEKEGKGTLYKQKDKERQGDSRFPSGQKHVATVGEKNK